MSATYFQLPADGSGKKIQTLTSSISAETVHTQVVHIGDKTDPTNMQAVDYKGAASVRFSEGEPLIDAYGNLKIEQDYIIAAYDHTTDPMDDLFSTVTADGASYLHDTNSGTLVISTDTSTGSLITRTTNRYHYYYPNQGNDILISVGHGDVGKENNVRRWGYFDEYNGIFFQLSGTALQVVIRSEASGTATDSATSQSSWNNDKCDGTGSSEFNIDLIKVNLYWISIQWPGRVRFGVIDSDGNRIVAHVHENVNTETLPYMRTPNLPLRFENYNEGIVGGGSDMRLCSMGIDTEGPVNYTFWRYSYSTTGFKNISTTAVPVISVRSKTAYEGHHNNINCYPDCLEVAVTGGMVKIDCYWPVTLSGDTWGLDNGSSLEADISAVGVIEDGNEWIMASFLAATGVSTFRLCDIFEIYDEGILLNANNSQVPFIITATKLSTGDTVGVYATLNYKELR